MINNVQCIPVLSRLIGFYKSEVPGFVVVSSAVPSAVGTAMSSAVAAAVATRTEEAEGV